MALKLFKAVWFFSLVATLAALLFVYASLPEQVVVREQGATLTSIPRDGLFYAVVGLLTFINVLVFLVGKVYAGNPDFRSWFYGLVVTLNIFFAVALNLIGTFNSGEHFNYSNIDFVIYGSVILIMLWASSWPIYSLYQKISTKQTV